MKKNFTNRDVELAVELVYSRLPKSQEARISTKELRDQTGLSLRVLKDYIAILRIVHPICTVLGASGGYWIAQTPEEMTDFISRLERRRNTMDTTIRMMREHQESLMSHGV